MASEGPSPETIELLERLIGFPTVSRDSNLQLIEFVRAYLDEHAIASTLTHNDERTKANLHAVIGPSDVPGVMLSGHTDVVPVDGQDWSSDPFSMRRAAGACYGRGTADMKGFIACVLAMAPHAVGRELTRPIHIALSYDEEIGCIGVRRMIDVLEHAPVRPAFCIVGEPTEMAVAIAHKGKTGALGICHGVSAHSALAPTGLNAIYLAGELIAAIRAMQDELIAAGGHDPAYAVPYTSLHVGVIAGGTQLNIVPNRCTFEFEIRNIAKDAPGEIMARVRAQADKIVERHRGEFPDCRIDIEVFNEYPGLDTSPEDEVVAFVKSLANANDHIKVAFGTEGGLFQQRLGVPTVVCGPGSMEQGHKPDEFITEEQLGRCDRFLAALVDRLSG